MIDDGFSPEQIKMAKQVSSLLRKLRKSGCTIIAKQTTLNAYLSKDILHAHPLHKSGNGSGIEIPYLECGRIDDAGADDTEYFEEGYFEG